MKKKCLIGLFGLYRTFEQTSINIQNNIINNNSDFEFDIVISTDLTNQNLSKWKEPTSKYNYMQKELEEKFHLSYNTNNQLIKILYLNNTDPQTSSGCIINKRVKQIMDYLSDENKVYEVYIIIRLDCILTNPINLNKFSTHASNGFKKINVITSTIKNDNRPDHNRDYDFCFISDKTGIELHFYLLPHANKNFTIKEFIEFCEFVNLKSSYKKDCIDSNEILVNEKYKSGIKILWHKLFNLYCDGYIVSFDTENQEIFCEIVR